MYCSDKDVEFKELESQMNFFSSGSCECLPTLLRTFLVKFQGHAFKLFSCFLLNEVFCVFSVLISRKTHNFNSCKAAKLKRTTASAKRTSDAILRLHRLCKR